MPYGRGGAGNILQAKENTKKVAEDIEANHPPSTTSSTPSTSQTPSEYMHTGRGGAGNWYEPRTLQQQGTFTSPSDATAAPTSAKPQISTPWHPEGQEMPVAKSGRGGAGNFVWKSEAEERKAEEFEMERRERVRVDVERDVEIGLKRPEGAVLGDKNGRGW